MGKKQKQEKALMFALSGAIAGAAINYFIGGATGYALIYWAFAGAVIGYIFGSVT